MTVRDYPAPSGHLDRLLRGVIVAFKQGRLYMNCLGGSVDVQEEELNISEAPLGKYSLNIDHVEDSNAASSIWYESIAKMPGHGD